MLRLASTVEPSTGQTLRLFSGKTECGNNFTVPSVQTMRPVSHTRWVMNIKRLPIAFLVLGLVFKAFLVFLWRHARSPGLLSLLTYYDPGARYFAERMTRLFFDHGGITLAPGAPTFFDIFLVIGFGIECLLVGFLLRWLLGRSLGRRGDEGLARAQTKPS